METEKELTEKILKITLTIQEKYPELIPHIEEMPDTIPNAKSPGINTKILRDYFESLNSLVKNYISKHTVLTEMKIDRKRRFKALDKLYNDVMRQKMAQRKFKRYSTLSQTTSV